MSLTGYLSLYTTLIGWQQYQSLWHVMVSTGLVFIPFISIVLNAFLEPFESQEPKSASVISIRRLGIHIVGALLVIEFCCVPIVPLNPQVLHYQPSCVPDAQVATPGHTGTTYDNQFFASYRLHFIITGSSNERFVDMIVGTLYVALPLLFLMLMSWAGYKVGQAVVGAVSSMISPASEGGSAAGRLGSAVLRSGVSVVKKY